MKIEINDYEVEIKAKFDLSGSKRFNQDDTMAVLNQIIIWAGEAACRYERLGLDGLAELARRNCINIRKELEKKGYYND